MNFPLSVNKSMQEYALVPRGLVAKVRMTLLTSSVPKELN